MGIIKRDVSAKSGRSAVTIIAQGNHFKGDTQVSGKMHVDGLFEGNIDSSEDISIGRHGCVRGRIRARNVTVSGVLEGELVCDQLHIERGGQVRATVYSDNLSIDSQGCFVGERRLQITPQLEYHPEEAVREKSGSIDYSLIDSLPDRITLSTKGS
ncbi:polymer-forming cytoskeletal protein [Marinobacterium sp. MBR-109]|uniref:bactofilin family protein n=1 Tax=Marinobacterium sp. MBR-109 TaxID=3156462 RepID=UPI0033950931